NRVIIAEQRLPRGLADDQQQQEIQSGDIGQRPATGDTEDDQQRNVDRSGAQDGVHGDLSGVDELGNGDRRGAPGQSKVAARETRSGTTYSKMKHRIAGRIGPQSQAQTTPEAFTA